MSLNLNLNGIGHTTKKADSSILNESVERMDDLEATFISHRLLLTDRRSVSMKWHTWSLIGFQQVVLWKTRLKWLVQVCCQEH